MLQVWSTLWRPLLPQHWLRAVLAADAAQVEGLNPAYLAALQFEEHAESAVLTQRLHAVANDPAAAAAGQAALQQLLQHPDRAASILPASGADESVSSDATVNLLLMSALAAGIDVQTAPLQLRPAAAPADVAADVRWLRRQQQLYAGKLQRWVSSTEGGRGSWQEQQRMASLYRLLHKHSLELMRMRSPGAAPCTCAAATQQHLLLLLLLCQCSGCCECVSDLRLPIL